MEAQNKTFSNVCRVCLQHGDVKNMVSLVDKTSLDGLSCYGKAVITFANISIKNDLLPTLLCGSCLLLLKHAIIFKKRCESSQKKLDNWLSKKMFPMKESKDKPVCMYQDISNKKLKSCDLGTQIEEVCQITSGSPSSGSISYDVNSSEFQDDCIDCDETSNDEDIDELLNQMEIYLKYSKKDERKLKFNPKNIEQLKTERKGGDDIIDKLFKNTKGSLNIKPEENDKKYFKNEDGIPLCQPIDSENEFFEPDEFSQENNYKESNESLDDLFKKMEMAVQFNAENQCFRKKLSKRQERKFKKYTRNEIPKPKIPKQRDIPCPMCNKILSNMSTYKNHMQRHTGYKFVCEFDAKGFASKHELQYHQAAMHGIGTLHICKYCGYKAPRKHELREHTRKHTGERPYTCDKCGQSFYRQFTWRKHMVFHSEKTVQCPKCPRKFFLRGYMLAHFNNIHERVYVYACSECNVTYAKSGTVRRHLTEKHGIPREEQGKIQRVTLGKSSIVEDGARLNDKV